MMDNETERSAFSTSERSEIVRLAKELSVPSYSCGNKFITMDRLDTIQRELAGSPYSFAVRKKIFHLYAQKGIENLENILLISSHADCLQPEAVFEDHGDYLRGIFDNALTNAVCVYLMKHRNLPRNVVFAFTGDEEDDEETEKFLRKNKLGKYEKKDKYEDSCLGALKVSKFLQERNKDFRTIVLDATYSGWDEGCSFTIENDFIYEKDRAWMQRMIKSVSRITDAWKFIMADPDNKTDNPGDYVPSEDFIELLPEKNRSHDDTEEGGYEVAWDDESVEYDAHDISCFSFCIPVGELGREDANMHSPDGILVKAESLESYIDALHAICCTDAE